jgi:RND family efflux transporter MFP subunit
MHSISKSSTALLLAGCLCLGGCSKPAPEEMTFPPPVVSVSAPVQRQVTDYQNFTGRARAVTTVQIRARVTGYLDKVHFKDGDLVKEKDVLCEIDNGLYRAAYDQAEANVAQYEARVSRLQADVDRNRGLVAKNSISLEEFEKYRTDLKEGQSILASMKAALNTAKLNLGYTQVASPVTGRVSMRNIDRGNLIKADDTILTTVVTLDPMYVFFDIDDRAYLHVEKLVRAGKLGEDAKVPTWLEGKSKHLIGGVSARIPVQLGLINEQGYPHDGMVNFIDNQIDSGTGTMRMRGVFDNKSGFLTPGLFVRVRLPKNEPHQAVLITDRAIETDHGQKVVYVVGKDNVAEKRPVELGGLHDSLREIISGVQLGDQVVVDGIQRVRPGAPVNPKTIDMPGADNAAANKTSKMP